MSRINLTAMGENLSQGEAGTALEQIAGAIANAGETEGEGKIGDGRYLWLVEPVAGGEAEAPRVKWSAIIEGEAVARG